MIGAAWCVSKIQFGPPVAPDPAERIGLEIAVIKADHVVDAAVAALGLDRPAAERPKKCAVPTMNISIGSEKIAFMTRAGPCDRCGGVGDGLTSPACTLRALAMTFFWLGQITSPDVDEHDQREQDAGVDRLAEDRLQVVAVDELRVVAHFAGRAGSAAR